MRRIFTTGFTPTLVPLLFYILLSACSVRSVTFSHSPPLLTETVAPSIPPITQPQTQAQIQTTRSPALWALWPSPPLEGDTSQGFCVAKYEMKNDGNNEAISQKEEMPWVGIPRHKAVTKCKNRGTGYDLITNHEWQSIARNIEQVPSNWAENFVGSQGGLSQGYSFRSERHLHPLEAGYDKDGCYGTGQTCNENTWHIHRRTHTLSNGNILWDIAGNIWEWVKDESPRFQEEKTLYIFQLTDRTLKKSFRPKGKLQLLQCKSSRRRTGQSKLQRHYPYHRRGHFTGRRISNMNPQEYLPFP